MQPFVFQAEANEILDEDAVLFRMSVELHHYYTRMVQQLQGQRVCLGSNFRGTVHSLDSKHVTILAEDMQTKKTVPLSSPRVKHLFQNGDKSNKA